MSRPVHSRPAPRPTSHRRRTTPSAGSHVIRPCSQRITFSRSTENGEQSNCRSGHIRHRGWFGTRCADRSRRFRKVTAPFRSCLARGRSDRVMAIQIGGNIGNIALSNRAPDSKRAAFAAALRQPKFVRDENTTLARGNFIAFSRNDDSVESRYFEARTSREKSADCLGVMSRWW